MRIKYNEQNKSSFKVFNDSMGIALNRNNIIRSKKAKYMDYALLAMLELFVATIFLVLMIILNTVFPCKLSVFLAYFAITLLFFIILSILYPLIFTTCFILKDENELEINEKGITFYLDDDQYVTLGWTHIKALVIGKYSMNFITDNLYYFYLDKKYKKELLNVLKEYNDSLLIIK